MLLLSHSKYPEKSPLASKQPSGDTSIKMWQTNKSHLNSYETGFAVYILLIESIFTLLLIIFFCNVLWVNGHALSLEGFRSRLGLKKCLFTASLCSGRGWNAKQGKEAQQEPLLTVAVFSFFNFVSSNKSYVNTQLFPLAESVYVAQAHTS